MLKDEISSGVSERTELFADIPGDTSEYCRAAEAFANTFGGKIIFGVGPDGNINGVGEYADRYAVRIHSGIFDSSYGKIDPVVYKYKLDGKWLIVAEIPRAMDRPVDSFGGLYRSGTSNCRLSASSRKDIEDERMNSDDVDPAFISTIECTRTRSNTIIDRRTFLGRPSDIIRPAVLFIEDHINISNIDGADRFEVPLEAIREFIINALKHRSYNHSEPVRIDINDTAIEIVSPGMIAYGLTVNSALAGCKRCRNPGLAYALDSDDCIGLSKAVSMCVENGLVRPDLVQDKEAVKVIIHRIRSLPDDGSMALMRYFTEHPQASITDASEELGMSVAIVRNNIGLLRQKGLLRREGSKKFGTWVISS